MFEISDSTFFCQSHFITFFFFLSKNAIDLFFILIFFFINKHWLLFMLFSLNNLTQIGTGTQSDNIKVSTQEAVPEIYTPT